VVQLPNQIKRWIPTGLSIVLFITLIISGILLFQSYNQSGYHLNWTKLNYSAAGLALLALLVSWFIEALRVLLIAHALGEKISLKQIININLAATFIGNITPFYSGGVPTQIFLLCQAGIKPGKSSAIVTMRVVLSTLLFTLFAPILLWFYRTNFPDGILHQVTTVAIPISIVISAFLILFVINPKLSKVLIAYPLKRLEKTRFYLKIEPQINKFLAEIELFHDSVQQFRKGYSFFLVVAATLAYWICNFAIAPFLIYAFNIKATGIFIKSVLIQFVLVFIISYLPVPGGAGLFELGFFTLFNFVPMQIRALFIFCLRLLNYNLITFVGGIILLRIVNRPAPQS